MSFNPELHTTMQEIVRARIGDMLAACDYAESVISDVNALVADAGTEIQHTIRPQVEAVTIEPAQTPEYPASAEQITVGDNVASLEHKARAAAAQQATHVNFEQLLIDAQRDAA